MSMLRDEDYYRNPGCAGCGTGEGLCAECAEDMARAEAQMHVERWCDEVDDETARVLREAHERRYVGVVLKF